MLFIPAGVKKSVRTALNQYILVSLTLYLKNQSLHAYVGVFVLYIPNTIINEKSFCSYIKQEKLILDHFYKSRVFNVLLVKLHLR